MRVPEQVARWIVPVTLIGGTLIWLRSATDPGPDILRKATRIAETNGWRADYSGYFWRTANEVWYCRDEQSGKPTLHRLNLQTGQSAPLTALNAKLTPRLGSSLWRLSLDGKWLLVGDYDRKQKTPTYVAFATDGSRQVRWPMLQVENPYLQWLNDSQRWVEFTFREGAVQPTIHSIVDKDTLAARLIGPCSWPIGVTPKDEVISAEQGLGKVEFYRYGLDPKVPSVHKSVVTIRTNGRITEIEPSPRGDRMAYLIGAPRRVPPLLDWWRQWFSPSRRYSGSRYTLLVSHADGSGLQEIGWLNDEALAGVQWTPDGARLSFFAQGGLYTIPAP
jgi:hypothetical protein